MRRVLASTVLLLGSGLLLAALSSLAQEPARASAGAQCFGSPRSDARSCKPQPPVEVSLAQAAVSDDGVVTLALAVTPHADAGAVDWSLQLPPGAELLDGVASGSLAAGSAGTGPLTARVRLPANAEAARVSLEVAGELAATAGAGTGERIAERRTLTWGRPSRNAGERLLHDLTTGATERVAEVPTAHREGR